MKKGMNTPVTINSLFAGKLSKGIVDVILLICLIICIHASSAFQEEMEQIRHGAGDESIFTWGTLHCLAGLVLVCFAGIHVSQRLNFYKALIRKKLYLKNKLATFVSVTFLFLLLSLLLFLTGFSESNMHFHLVFAHLFAIAVIIHSVTRLRQFVLLFRGKSGIINRQKNE